MGVRHLLSSELAKADVEWINGLIASTTALYEAQRRIGQQSPLKLSRKSMRDIYMTHS